MGDGVVSDIRPIKPQKCWQCKANATYEVRDQYDVFFGVACDRHVHDVAGIADARAVKPHGWGLTYDLT